MQTFIIGMDMANPQESLNQLDAMVKKASFIELNPGNPYHNRKIYRKVSCFHDTAVTFNRGEHFLIRGVEFEEPRCE